MECVFYGPPSCRSVDDMGNNKANMLRMECIFTVLGKFGCGSMSHRMSGDSSSAPSGRYSDTVSNMSVHSGKRMEIGGVN